MPVASKPWNNFVSAGPRSHAKESMTAKTPAWTDARTGPREQGHRACAPIPTPAVFPLSKYDSSTRRRVGPITAPLPRGRGKEKEADERNNLAPVCQAEAGEIAAMA